MSTPRRDYMVVAATWLLVGAVFWSFQDDWSWNALFPLAGFVWIAAPLVLTRFRTQPMLIVSGISLLIAISVFLFMHWYAIVVFAFIGSLFFDSEPFPSVAPALVIHALKVVPGALVGTALGLVVRSGLPSWSSSLEG